MLGSIIFIGGIHGVGKGTLCKEICKTYPFEHLIASKILKWEEISEKENKKVENFESTQSRLLNGLKKLIKPNSKYLLDGHFCLLNKKGEPEKISENIFFDIKPKAIVTLTCDPKIILNRLNNRDNSIYEEEVLTKMQDLELNYSLEIASKLNIPFLRVEGQRYESLFQLLKDL